MRLGRGPSRSTTGRRVVARHERAVGRYVEVLSLDHYLEVLETKPGALPGATALAQAKARGVFTPPTRRYWDAARRARGDAGGTRALIEILLAHRTLPAAALIAAMDAGRRLRDAWTRGRASSTPAAAATHRRAGACAIGALARYDRPAPTLAGYDDLLLDRGSEHMTTRLPPTPPPRPPSAPPPASCTYPPCAPKPTAWPRSPSGNATPTWATSPKSWPPRSTTAPNAAGPDASTKPSSPGSNASRTSTSTPSPPSARHPGTPRRRALHGRRRTRRAAR